jgi:hypothetical protein
VPARKTNPDARYAALVARFVGEAGVTHTDKASRSFGATALKVNGKIFAMLVNGALVLKLPKKRVDALVEQARGTRFDANKGTPMKEWIVLDESHSDAAWLELAREAKAFVG